MKTNRIDIKEALVEQIEFLQGASNNAAVKNNFYELSMLTHEMLPLLLAAKELLGEENYPCESEEHSSPDIGAKIDIKNMSVKDLIDLISQKAADEGISPQVLTVRIKVGD